MGWGAVGLAWNPYYEPAVLIVEDPRRPPLAPNQPSNQLTGGEGGEARRGPLRLLDPIRFPLYWIQSILVQLSRSGSTPRGGAGGPERRGGSLGDARAVNREVGVGGCVSCRKVIYPPISKRARRGVHAAAGQKGSG